MKIELAGLVHYDPLGKQRLLRWLYEKKEDKPKFVAVEWDPRYFEDAKRQRPYFRDLVLKEWPDASESFLSAIVDSLGYEGDTHNAIFPDTQTIWLDKGRDLFYPDAVEKFADERFYHLKKLMRYVSSFDHNGLRELSVLAWQISKPTEKGDERDKKLAEAIHSIFRPNENGWGIAITGNNHSDAIPENMAHILKRIGFTCSFQKLSPDFLVLDA